MSISVTFSTPEDMSRFSKVVAAEVMAAMKPASDFISQREAYRLFTQSWVDARTAEGKLKTMRATGGKTSTIRYSRVECMKLLAYERQLAEGLVR